MLLVTDLTSTPVFDAMPSLSAGRCWLFAANEDLSPRFGEVSAKVDGFLSQWAAHGLPVEAGSALICGHFLAIAEGLAGEASSGCSQDAMRGMVQGLEKAFGTSLIAGGRIFYRDADSRVVVTSRTGFQAAARAGALGPETWVFDTLVQAAGDLRLGRFLVQAKDTWHQKLIPVAFAN
jgi:hypothetical protein